MKNPLSLCAIAVLVVSTDVAIAAPWPQAEKASAVATCRDNIRRSAERNYLSKNNLTELPPGFQEKAAPLLEPYFASCTCLVDQLETQWSFEEFRTNRAQLGAKAKELFAGVCAPKRPSAAP